MTAPPPPSQGVAQVGKALHSLAKAENFGLNLSHREHPRPDPCRMNRINGIIRVILSGLAKRYVKEQTVAQQHTHVMQPYRVGAHWPTERGF